MKYHSNIEYLNKIKKLHEISFIMSFLDNQ